VSLHRFISPRLMALLVLIGSLATILGAWFIELVLGIKPCHLCLIGRMPHYAGIAVALLAVLIIKKPSPNPLIGRFLLAFLALIFLTGTAIAVYHSGVEFGVFQGPTDCTGTIEKPVAIQDFLKQLQTVKVIRCDEVAMRILGLSLASWNAVICAGLAVVAGVGAVGSRHWAVGSRK
jgi:disulfide bond formation protein DsbB